MKLILVLFCLSQCLLLNTLLVGADPSGDRCPQVPDRKETCVCQAETGIIDLTPLSNTDGTPRYSGLKGNRGYTYDYNPCSTFQDAHNKGDCDDIHLCQSNQYVIGGDPGDEEMWIDTDGTPYAYYEKHSLSRDRSSNQQFTDETESTFADDNRIGIVHLICDHSVSLADSQLTMVGELSRYHYYFNLTSCQVCPGGCQSHHHNSQPKKNIIGFVGLAILAVLLVAIVAYFVAGIIIMKFHKKATGTDVIPNKALWIATPFLIKDGCVFTFGPCVRLVKEKIAERRGRYTRMN